MTELVHGELTDSVWYLFEEDGYKARIESAQAFFAGHPCKASGKTRSITAFGYKPYTRRLEWCEQDVGKESADNTL